MQTVLRAAFFYVFLLVAFRIMGKREVGSLTPFELVTLLLIPETASQAIVRDDFSLVNAMLACTTFLGLAFMTSILTHRFASVERVVEGQSRLLVRHGKFIDKHMNRERIVPDEVLSEVHRSGLESLDEVKWAILEDDGTITVVPFTRSFASSTSVPTRAL